MTLWSLDGSSVVSDPAADFGVAFVLAIGALDCGTVTVGGTHCGEQSVGTACYSTEVVRVQ